MTKKFEQGGGKNNNDSNGENEMTIIKKDRKTQFPMNDGNATMDMMIDNDTVADNNNMMANNNNKQQSTRE